MATDEFFKEQIKRLKANDVIRNYGEEKIKAIWSIVRNTTDQELEKIVTNFIFEGKNNPSPKDFSLAINTPKSRISQESDRDHNERTKVRTTLTSLEMSEYFLEMIETAEKAEAKQNEKTHRL